MPVWGTFLPCSNNQRVSQRLRAHSSNFHLHPLWGPRYSGGWGTWKSWVGLHSWCDLLGGRPRGPPLVPGTRGLSSLGPAWQAGGLCPGVRGAAMGLRAGAAQCTLPRRAWAPSAQTRPRCGQAGTHLGVRKGRQRAVQASENRSHVPGREGAVCGPRGLPASHSPLPGETRLLQPRPLWDRTGLLG